MTTSPAPNPPAGQRSLRRREDNRIIAGVAAGVADYLDLDPVAVRIALVAAVLFGGIGLPIYAAAWLLMPRAGDEASIAEDLVGSWRMS